MTTELRTGLYKTRSSTQSFTTTQRIEVTEKLRRESRLTLMLQKRNITAYMSPINSPGPSTKKEVDVKKKSKADERLELLKKWKEQKKKRLEQAKIKAKPIFKVHHLNHTTKPDLNDIYSKIKGKVINNESKNKSVMNDTKHQSFKFVPSSTYKFKAPANVKPISMKVSKNNSRSVVQKIDFKINDTLAVNSPRKTKTLLTKKINDATTDNTNIKNRRRSERLTPKRDVESTKISKSPITPKNNLPLPNFNTPEKDKPIAYVSPFVTVSRGKENARNEYIQRKSNLFGSPNNTNSQQNSTPKAAANFFSNLLYEQKERLTELCQFWKEYEEQEDPPEEACDMIRMAIGQTELLLTKKLNKFTDLITACRNRDSENVVTCIDLHGFWDIIMIQVHNLDKRFENLKRLKSNDWKEILPELPSKKQKKPKKDVKKKEVKSRLRDLIKEARKKMEDKSNINFSPVVELKTHDLLSNISNTMPQSIMTTPVKLIRKGTPKSILKSGQKLKRKSNKKSVLFVEENKENLCNSFNLIEFSPHELRRSSRLAVKKQ